MPRLLVLALALSGCARFIDERPPGPDPALIQPSDDAGPSDTTGLSDADANGDRTVAAGQFIQAFKGGGDTGSGSVSLVRAPDGSERIVFGGDFTSTPVPAGEVVLTSRASIGQGGIQSGFDLDLGPLTQASGAQSYAVPGGDGGRRRVFVYCVTYGVDVTVAALQ